MYCNALCGTSWCPALVSFSISSPSVETKQIVLLTEYFRVLLQLRKLNIVTKCWQHWVGKSIGMFDMVDTYFGTWRRRHTAADWFRWDVQMINLYATECSICTSGNRCNCFATIYYAELIYCPQTQSVIIDEWRRESFVLCVCLLK